MPTPSRALERRALLGMCILIAVNQLGFGAIVPSLPLYALSFGVSASAIGLAVAVYGLARFVVAVPSGRVSDALGRRPALALGGLTTALGSLWCAAAESYPEFIAARFVAGAGAGAVLTTGQGVLADITSPERRGRGIAIYQGTFIFSVGIGPLPGGWLAETYGLPAPFVANAIAGTVAGLVAWFLVPETKGLSGNPANNRGLPSYGRQIRHMLRQLGFMLVGLIGFTNALVRTGGLFTIIPVLGSVRLGLSVAEIGFGLAAGSVMGLLVTYPSGMLVDYFGRKAVIVPATLLSGSAMLLFCLAPSFEWFLIACIVWGVATSTGGAAPASYAADAAPAGMNAAAMSTFRMIGDLGYVIGPILAGLIVDAYSAETALIAAAASLMTVGVFFGVFAPEAYRGNRARDP